MSSPTAPTFSPQPMAPVAALNPTGPPLDLASSHAYSPFTRPPVSPTAQSRPIPNSYWATPKLLACEYPFSPSSPRPKLDALLAAGVRTFIDLTEPGELAPYTSYLRTRALRLGLSADDVASVEYHRFAIPDRGLPTSETVASILGVLHETCDRGNKKAAVHCRGGIGRTGTIVGCYLVNAGYARDGDEALQIVADKWRGVEKCRRFPCSPETGAQVDFVKAFQKLGVQGSSVPNTVSGAMRLEAGGRARARW